LRIEVVGIIDPDRATSHQDSRERVDLLLWMSHPSYDAYRHYHQPDEEDAAQHRQHNDQYVACGLD